MEFQAIKDTLDVIVRLMLLTLIQQVIVVKAKLLLETLQLILVKCKIILLVDAVSNCTRPLSLNVLFKCDRLYLLCLIHQRVPIIWYCNGPIRVGGRLNQQGVRGIIFQRRRMLVWQLQLQWLHRMLLLLHDLFLEVAEMIVNHHVVIFPAWSDEWRRQ